MSDVDRQMACLLRGNRRERETAAAALRSLGAEAVPDLVAYLRAKNPSNGWRFAFWFTVSGLASAGAVLLLASIARAMWGWSLPDAALLALLSCLPALVVGMLKMAVPAQLEAAAILADCRDPRALGALIEALDYPGADLEAPVRRAVTGLLEEATPEAYAALSEKQRAKLREELRTTPPVLSVNLLQSILRAVERFGDTRATGAVEMLLRRVSGPDALQGNDALRMQAARCLASLQALRARQQEAQALLRPAAPPADTLLRPAQGALNTDVRLLLRPEENETGR